MAKTIDSSNIQREEHLTISAVTRPKSKNWIDFINDTSSKPVIPVGPVFQANVPEWTGPPHKNNVLATSFDETKWLGTRIWPSKYACSKIQGIVIGEGRPNFCSCSTLGSVECVKLHVDERRAQLKSELGSAFREWKFDEMGDEVSKLWDLKERQMFRLLVKLSFESQNKNFVKLALEHLSTKSRQMIVNYYFNVYVPRRMGWKYRSGYTIINSDDEAEEDIHSNGSVKRRRHDNLNLYNSKYMNALYFIR